MNNIQKRFLLFLIGCIGIRTLFVYISKTIDIKYLPILGYIALPIGIGFIIIYLKGLRKTGQEVFGEKIWWNDLRPIHGVLYILFAYFAITQNTKAWQLLLLDVVIGFSTFLIYHYRQGDFKKL